MPKNWMNTFEIKSINHKTKTKEEKSQNKEEKGKEANSFNNTIVQTHFGLVNLSIDNH